MHLKIDSFVEELTGYSVLKKLATAVVPEINYMETFFIFVLCA